MYRSYIHTTSSHPPRQFTIWKRQSVLYHQMIPRKSLGSDRRVKKSTARKCLVCLGNVWGSNNYQDPSDILSTAGPSVPEKDDVSVFDPGPHARLCAALNTLKEQHAALAKAVSSISYTDGQSTSLSSSLVLPPRVDEGEEPQQTESPASASASLFRSRSKRSSVVTNTSDSLWFDAPEFDDGPEEFLLESIGADDHGPDSRIIDSNDREDSNSVDTDIEGEETPKREPVELPSDPSRVIRRVQLPSLPPADEGSLFAVLKKNVGKVCSVGLRRNADAHFALGFIQCSPACHVQRAPLITSAGRRRSRILRPLNASRSERRFGRQTMLCCRFCRIRVCTHEVQEWQKGIVSGPKVHLTLHLLTIISNPMLGETFEDPRMKFIAEKVSHNPFIMAYHAEGEGWELWASSAGRTKFWGNSFFQRISLV